MIRHNKIFDEVYRIIKEKASQDKPINQNQIIAFLNEDLDNECDRKTVGRALEKLRDMYGVDEDGNPLDENVKLHYEVKARSSSPIFHKYWLEIIDDDGFTDEELFFLMDAVQFSKHINQNYAEEIIGKLAKLSHSNNCDAFEFYKRINDKNVPVRKDFFLILGDINTAIREQRMLSFYECNYGVDLKLKRACNDPVIVCPYRVVVSDGYHYLLCSKKDTNVIKSYRIDLISDVTVLDETYTHNAARKIVAIHPEEYLAEHRYMNTGETVSVTLLIDRSILSDVIDAFGTHIKIDSSDESINHLYIHIKSSEKDVIEWAMRYGEYAVVVEPDYIKEEIRSKAGLLMTGYGEKLDDIRYQEAIIMAKKDKRIWLSHIDISEQDSYKYLKDIQRANFNHNWIKDFSFLSEYKDLRTLRIVHNEIQNPEYLSSLSKLNVLDLGQTGITNLDFLTGLNNLTCLSIHEFNLENVEAIYSLPALHRLSVNKPVARLIDKKRLKKVYGDSFKYSADNHGGMMVYRRPALPNKTLKGRELNWNKEMLMKLSTRKVTESSERTKLCSEIYSGLKNWMRSPKLFSIVEQSCDEVERKRLFENIGHYAASEYVWYATYDEYDNAFAISIFKNEHGLKLIAMARRNRPVEGIIDAREIYDKIYCSLEVHILFLMNNKIGWCEISDELEKSFMRVCTMKDVIDPSVFVNNNIYRGIEIDIDDYHYYRLTDNGRKTEKRIAYGHIELG